MARATRQGDFGRRGRKTQERVRRVETKDLPPAAPGGGGGGSVVAAQACRLDDGNQTIANTDSGYVELNYKVGHADITLVDNELIVPYEGWWLGHIQLAGRITDGGRLDPDTFVTAGIRRDHGGEIHWTNASVPITDPAFTTSDFEEFTGSTSTPPFKVVADDIGGVSPARLSVQISLANANTPWEVLSYGDDTSDLDNEGFPTGWDVTILSLRYLGAL